MSLRRTLTYCILLTGLASPAARGGDWPTWRYDASRCGVSPHSLPARLAPRWVLELPAPRSAWPETQKKLQFDRSYQPIVAGKLLIVASMVRDSVTAYDTETGREVWRFYADGPVRFAPVAHEGRVYFVSDDGYLYCLDVRDGRKVWKFRGGPDGRRVLGNERMISTWPARGGPVLYDGTVYFAAGIWPFMGVFVHAVDAQTGKAVWTNSGTGSLYLPQEHSSEAFAGVAPQGYLAATDTHLLVAGGRTTPAVFDRQTGKLLYFTPDNRGLGGLSKLCGGWNVMVRGEWFINHWGYHRLSNGQAIRWAEPDHKARWSRSKLDNVLRPLMDRPRAMFSGDLVLSTLEGVLQAHEAAPTVTKEPYKDRRGRDRVRLKIESTLAWQAAVQPAMSRVCIQVGGRVYGTSADGRVMAVDLPVGEERPARVGWVSGPIAGKIWTMLAGAHKLFVVTEEGAIHCFARDDGRESPPVRIAAPASEGPKRNARADAVVQATGLEGGYCLVLGLGDGSLAEGLLAASDAKPEHEKLRVLVVESDAKKVLDFRRRMDARGLYGRRMSVITADPRTVKLPPYFASVVAWGDAEPAGSDDLIASVFRTLRPYGGTASLPAGLVQAARAAKLTGAEIASANGMTLLRRPGALPGSADWTHQYGDVANTVVSRDTRVRAPLGLLWFGGPSHAKILPRHGHGPNPHVVAGRVIIEGPDLLRALDAYTGRLLWERRLDNVGKYHDFTGHQAGANVVGGNYASAADAIYVAYGQVCLVLDPATGKTVKEFRLPATGGRQPNWGYVGVYGDLLIAGASPLEFAMRWNRDDKRMEFSDPVANSRQGAGSKRLVVMDRHSGKVLWKRDAKAAFRHNTIVAGGGRIYCMDSLTEKRIGAMRRRGQAVEVTPELYALDARTGKVVWRTDRDVFGTWLAYSSEHDVLLQANSHGRDRARDEARLGVAARKAGTGKVLWMDKKYDNFRAGPFMIHHGRILNQKGGFDLLTGKRAMRIHPLTGQLTEWGFTRNYGCNTPIGAEHLLLFRSAAAGYFDLAGDSGTGNMGGFKSGCSSNLIAAGGVLSAPDYTRTCICAYQNQTSLAMIHMPDAEMWTFNALPYKGERITRLGLNLGAPGDRKDDSGTLWLEYPFVGGPTPAVPIVTAPEAPATFRFHTSQIGGKGPRWVAASGLRGLRTLTVRLAAERVPPVNYTVRLHFIEPDGLKAGKRRFSVAIGGRTVLRQLDIAAEAGANAREPLVKEFKGVPLGNTLTVILTPAGDGGAETILCGLEVIAEDLAVSAARRPERSTTEAQRGQARNDE